MDKKVFYFGEKKTDGGREMKELLGGKGANLAEMTSIGLPVPPGFTISTEVCQLYNDNNGKLPKEVEEEVDKNLELLEEEMGKKFGDPEDPLLLSVRSGAAKSMPGMMDTVLNIGLNDTTVQGLIVKSGEERFGYDAYRRFVQMFGNVVLGVEGKYFEKEIERAKETKGVEYDTDLTVDDLKDLVASFKKIIKDKSGEDFPDEPRAQVYAAIDAVFGSWNNDRAILYRKLNNLTGLIGTAVNVQTMVFGNLGETSGTGVAFTRNPSTGENKFYGEFLMNAQGEDVVAGVRTPKSIEELHDVMPECYKELMEVREKLEEHYKEMEDLEFTIQEGKLYILQTRDGKRTAIAAVKIAVDMESEGLIDQKEAVLRVEPEQLDQLLHKRIDPIAKQEEYDAKYLTKGLPASPGAAVGEIIFDAHKADEEVQKGKKVILVRNETSPEDLIGMNAARGILTAIGGMTSHAAIVARGMGKCCVAGCGDLDIDEEAGTMKVKGETFSEGDYITLDGSTGEVFEGKLSLVDPEVSGNFEKIMEWSDQYRDMKVRTNADTPKDAKKALEFGAEGIGLCRTEHMFFEGERIRAMREMILSNTEEERRKALDKILPMQKEDFKNLFKVMEGKPVTIRLLDPPLHEFIPHEEEEQKAISKEMGVSLEDLKKTMTSLEELNPMLGHRGCRLLISYPEIAEMQTTAIIKATLELKEDGQEVVPEIMIPLVGHMNEFKELKKIVTETADKLIVDSDSDLDYKVGTMIEVPRGALTADKIAEEAEFFSFGTNDLTQMTFGFSRDDVGKFINEYKDKGILEQDPFQVLDQEGVGQLVKTAFDKGRSVKKDLKVGICGEHGGEPSSVEFCYKVGLNYVSCSPFRVPIARLVAAQAALKKE